MILIVLGSVLVLYDLILCCVSPSSLIRTLFTINHVFSLLGGYLIFEGIYHRKNKKYFFGTLKKKIRITIGLIILSGILMCFIQTVFILTPDTVKLNEKSDYVIVLGGGIDKKGKLPLTVKRRLEKAAEYLILNPETTCVVTGGTLKFVPFPEAPEMKRQLINMGVSENRILIEDKALDTIQNFKKSADLLAQTQNRTIEQILESEIVVVTSNFHLARAERIAKRMGFKNIKGIKSGTPFYIVPISLFRENCSYLKLNLRILLTGKPNEITIY